MNVVWKGIVREFVIEYFFKFIFLFARSFLELTQSQPTIDWF